MSAKSIISRTLCSYPRELNSRIVGLPFGVRIGYHVFIRYYYVSYRYEEASSFDGFFWSLTAVLYYRIGKKKKVV